MAGELAEGQKTSKAAFIVVDGQRVTLSPEGIERAGEKVGKKIVEAVRAEVDRATDGQ